MAGRTTGGAAEVAHWLNGQCGGGLVGRGWRRTGSPRPGRSCPWPTPPAPAAAGRRVTLPDGGVMLPGVDVTLPDGGVGGGAHMDVGVEMQVWVSKCGYGRRIAISRSMMRVLKGGWSLFPLSLPPPPPPLLPSLRRESPPQQTRKSGGGGACVGPASRYFLTPPTSAEVGRIIAVAVCDQMITEYCCKSKRMQGIGVRSSVRRYNAAIADLILGVHCVEGTVRK